MFRSETIASRISLAADLQSSNTELERRSISQIPPEYAFSNIFLVSFSEICCIILFIETLLVFGCFWVISF